MIHWQCMGCSHVYKSTLTEKEAELIVHYCRPCQRYMCKVKEVYKEGKKCYERI
jgi:hypothetical protein